MLNFSIFEDIKQRTNCLDLAQELGLSVKSGSALCIFHTENTPSLHIYADGYYCYGCGERGSVIDLYMRVRDVDLLTASRELAARAGLAWPEKNEEAQAAYEAKLSRQAAMQQHVTAWVKALRPDDIQYLKSRGFTEEFIKDHSFGYCAQTRPQDTATARELGLLTGTEDGRGWYMPGGRLTVPFYAYGRLEQVAFHKPGSTPKYLYPAGWPKPLLVSSKREETPFLCEGVFDYYSLLQAGLPAACGLGTQLSTEQKAALANVAQFYICFDGDVRGREAAQKLAREFYPAAKVVNLPDGKDVNDLLQEQDVDAFGAYMHEAAEQAQDYLGMQLDKLSGEPSDAQARQEAIAYIARLTSDTERDLKLERLAKLLKPLGIGKAAIRTEVEKARKTEQAMDGEAADDGADKLNQAQMLIALAAGVELFHTPDNTGYASFLVDGHKETWPLRSGGFRRWLVKQFFAAQDKPPSTQALQDTLAVLEAQAHYDAPELPVFVRLAEADGKVYIDMCNAAWEAVEVTQHGWNIVSEYPVKFRRTNGMLPLPLPVQGGTIADLRPFVNIGGQEDWCLLVAWVVAALRPRGPYPVLNLHGEHGSAKSTVVRVLRALLDPAVAPMRSAPRDERDLAIAACNAWLVAYDNLSGLPAWLSDALCRVSTGGGFATRTLYSDDEETIFDYVRPVVINGIDEVITRHDLLDRSLLMTLPVIPEAERQDEAAFWAAFEQARPSILGALLDAVAAGLRNIAGMQLAALPRMADFAKWVAACEPALPWEANAFLTAYAGKRAEAVETALEADAVAVAINALLAERTTWEGTATELLATLETNVTEHTARSKAWPKSARGLGNRLRRAATFLRHAGVEVEFVREGKVSRRLIRIGMHSIVGIVGIVGNVQETYTPQELVAQTQTPTQTDCRRNTSSANIFASAEEANEGNCADEADEADAKKHIFSNLKRGTI